MWSLAGSQAFDQLIGCEPGSRMASLSAALGLSHGQAAGGIDHFGTESHGAGLSTALGPSHAPPVFLLLWVSVARALA